MACIFLQQDILSSDEIIYFATKFSQIMNLFYHTYHPNLGSQIHFLEESIKFEEYLFNQKGIPKYIIVNQMPTSQIFSLYKKYTTDLMMIIKHKPKCWKDQYLMQHKPSNNFYLITDELDSPQNLKMKKLFQNIKQILVDNFEYQQDSFITEPNFWKKQFSTQKQQFISECNFIMNDIDWDKLSLKDFMLNKFPHLKQTLKNLLTNNNTIAMLLLQYNNQIDRLMWYQQKIYLTFKIDSFWLTWINKGYQDILKNLQILQVDGIKRTYIKLEDMIQLDFFENLPNFEYSIRLKEFLLYNKLQNKFININLEDLIISTNLQNNQQSFKHQIYQTLGASILKFIVSYILYINDKNSTEGQMSFLRSNLISNKNLQKQCKETFIQNFISIVPLKIQHILCPFLKSHEKYKNIVQKYSLYNKFTDQNLSSIFQAILAGVFMKKYNLFDSYNFLQNFSTMSILEKKTDSLNKKWSVNFSFYKQISKISLLKKKDITWGDIKELMEINEFNLKNYPLVFSYNTNSKEFQRNEFLGDSFIEFYSILILKEVSIWMNFNLTSEIISTFKYIFLNNQQMGFIFFALHIDKPFIQMLNSQIDYQQWKIYAHNAYLIAQKNTFTSPKIIANLFESILGEIFMKKTSIEVYEKLLQKLFIFLSCYFIENQSDFILQNLKEESFNQTFLSEKLQLSLNDTFLTESMNSKIHWINQYQLQINYQPILNSGYFLKIKQC